MTHLRTMQPQIHMAKQYHSRLYIVGIMTALLSCLGLPSQGQALRVRPDGTTQTNITESAQCIANCTITGNSRLGNNLFHSFSEFSIPANVTATFKDDGATNIFTRVSGGASSINGTLAVTGKGQANFFLINPQGISFGPQATLVSSGSFIATTADRVVFSDDTTFSATERTTPLLTISTPVGVQFGEQPGDIVNRSQASPDGALNSLRSPVGLQVKNGQTLAFIGSSIRLDGGNLTASSSRIEIGSVAAGSYVSLSPEFALGYAETSTFQDIQLTGTAAVDVSGNRGSITARGRNISITGESAIANFTLGGSSSGAIKLIADGTVEISGLGIFFVSFPGSVGDGTTLDITARRLTLQDGGLIAGGTSGQANGGSVTIDASEAVELSGTSDFSPSLITTSTEGAGTGGALIIDTPQLSVTNGAQIQAVTFGPGKGGDITVRATDRVDVRGTGETTFSGQVISGIRASSGLEGRPFQATGEGGSLTIKTGILNLDEGAQVAVDSLGSGDSGNLAVNARAIRLDNGAELTAASTFGNGGNIQLENLETLVLRRGSEVSTRAGTGDGQGNGGNISIEADYIVTNLFEDSDIIAKATQGRGGNITISTRGLYGITERRAIAGNGTNDIDASSDFGVSGTIAINRLIDDTDQGLVSLSDSALETTSVVSQGCQANGNRLIVTRRGGLPTNPIEPVETVSPLVDLGRRYLAPDSIETGSSETETVTANNRGEAHERTVLNNRLSADRNTRTTSHTRLTNADPESAASAESEVSNKQKETGWVEASHWRRDENNRVVLGIEDQRENLVALQTGSSCT